MQRTTYPLITLSIIIFIGAIFSNSLTTSPLLAQGGDSPPLKDTNQITKRFQEPFTANSVSLLPGQSRQGLVECVDGEADGYPCKNVDLLAHVTLGDLGSTGIGNDIWGWTDPLSGTEYALMGMANGTSFVDLSDPENPVVLGVLPTHTSSSSWRDIKVYADHAFIVSEASGHGMQVFDLTQLRDVTNPPVTFSETAHYDGFGNAHNLVINEESGFAYGVGGNCSGGLHQVNIQDPTSPVSAGCVSSDGYTHDAQCIIYDGPDTDYQGNELCFNSNEDTLTIFDVTVKNSPVLVARQGYAGSSYTHQGWITEDHTHFLLDDETDETGNGHNTRTYIWDISDLDNPVLIGNHTATTAASDHNLYIKDNLVYQSNYRAGLRILDISDIANANLTEIAYFDTYPPNDNPGASSPGSWSNYPYFESGIVIVSSIDAGLFIVRPTGGDFSIDVAPSKLNICETSDATYQVSVSSLFDFSGPASLSTTNQPGGSSVSFSVNPVTPAFPPATSTLTITGAVVGSYNINVIGTTTTKTHTSTVTLDVSNAIPDDVTLTTPANSATNIALSPTFEWNVVAGAGDYTIEIATDAGFSNIVYSATEVSTSHTANTTLDPLTTYYWRVKANNACGTGSFSAAFSFTTRPIPPVLLVDDDDNSPDVTTQHTDVLDTLGITYDIWDTESSDNEPTAAQLAPYQAVIWYTGDAFGGSTGPGGSGEAALGAYLDAGHCLLINSQDYFYARGTTSFMQTYLGLGVGDSDVSQTTVTGAGSVFSGLGPYTLVYPFDNYSDDLTPDASAELAFTGNAGIGDAAINKDSGVYKTAWLGFPFEALPDAAAREEVMATFINWCGLVEQPSISLTKTVGTDPGVCATTPSIMVNYGNEVTYCYEVTNTGPATLTQHSLVDDHLGTIISDASVSLAPGASYFVTQTTTITEDTVNLATWTAYNPGPIDIALASDSATVTLTEPDLELTKTASTDGLCGVSNDITVVGEADITYCYTVNNTGNVALDVHTLFDDQLGLLLDDVSQTLNPNDTYIYTTTVTISNTTVNSATWHATATGQSYMATDSAVATVTVVAPVYSVTVGALLDTLLGSAGDTVTYTVWITNAGNTLDSFNISVSSTWASNVPASVGPLATNASQNIQVGVTIPVSATANQSDTLTLTATSQNDAAQNDQLDLNTIVSAAPITHGVAITAPVTAISDIPGQSVTYTIWVSNTGNVADTFAIALDGNIWVSNSDASFIALQAGESEQIEVYVSIPLTATTYQSDTVNVIVTSQGDGAESDSLVLTTSVLPIYGVDVMAPVSMLSDIPGRSVTYTVWVSNTGLVSDTFSISVSGQNWTTSPSTNVVSLASEVNTSLEVSISIPLTATTGQSDTATIDVTSQGDASQTAQVDLTTVVTAVISINNPPLAVDDTATTDENTAVTISVLANDSDPDGDDLSVVDVSNPANGSSAISGPQIVYTPTTAFTGTDTFSYTISDGQETASAIVTITVKAVATNNPPLAVDDTATTDKNTAVTISVLANDSDPDGDALSVVDVSSPANGNAVISTSSGSSVISGTHLVYTPTTNFSGTDTFSYTISDGQETASALVTVTVADNYLVFLPIVLK